MKKRLSNDGKIGIVTLICMFILAFAAAIKGTYVNPIAIGAPAYMYILRIIIGARCPVIRCSLMIIAVTLLALAYYVI